MAVGVPAVYCSVDFDVKSFGPHEFAKASLTLPERLRGAVHKRQAEFLAGRLCARAALGELGYPAAAPAINADRSPAWPRGVVGAITHNDHRAAAIVALASDCLAIGLDCESIAAVAQTMEVAEDILTPTEREIYAQLAEAARVEFLALAFSVKESLFKALYPIVGCYFDFQSARLLRWEGGETGCVEIELCIGLSTQWPRGSRFVARYLRRDGRVTAVLAVPR